MRKIMLLLVIVGSLTTLPRTTAQDCPESTLMLNQQVTLVSATERSGMSDLTDNAYEMWPPLQPNTVLVLINGPECNAGSNWWQVAYEENRGWLPESDANGVVLTPLAPEATLPYLAVMTPDASVSLNNVTFNYTGELGGRVLGQLIAPVEPIEEGPYWIGNPQYRLFEFLDYPFEHFHRGRIYIYPIEDYIAMNEYVSDGITQLATILAEKPPLSSYETLPFLPIFNAAQVFHSNHAYLDLPNDGIGIRYLTMFSQAPFPINNNDIFYTFQGITGDGLYYIAAVLPITSPELAEGGMFYLAEDALFEMLDKPDAGQLITTYLQAAADGLGSLGSDSFDPTLDTLDQLIGSLDVGSIEIILEPTAQG